MAEPNAVADMPLVYQILLGLLTFAVTVAGTLWAFFSKLTKPHNEPPTGQYAVLESAELTDVNAIRNLAREFRPALEKLTHIDQLGSAAAERDQRVEALIKEIANRLDKMDRAAEVARKVREELDRRVSVQERRNERRDRDDHD